jgi:hypothetical protein
MCINGQLNSNARSTQHGNQDACNGTGVSANPKAVSGSGSSQPSTQTDVGDITDPAHPTTAIDEAQSDPSVSQDKLMSMLIEILMMLVTLLMQLLGISPDQKGASSTQGAAPVGTTSTGGVGGGGGGGAGSAGGNAPSTPSAPSTAGAPPQSNGASNAGQSIPVDGGGPNTITVRNNSNREQNYALFVNPAEGQTTSFDVPHGFVTLKPGESASFKLPASPAPGRHTSGYVQQMNNYTQADYQAKKKPDPENFKATRAEYTFDHDGKLWFNTSHILGYNAALTMSGNGQVAGSSDTILSAVEKGHPNLVQTVGGQKVIVGPQGFTAGTNMESAQVLNEMLNHSSNPGDIKSHTTTYVLPPDDSAMRGGKGPGILTLDFGNA